MTENSIKIAFIGGGNMASAIIDRILDGELTPQELLVIEPADAARSALAARGINTHALAHADLTRAGVWVLAVKPQAMREVCGQVAPFLSPGQLVISIAAGLPLASISPWLNAHARMARAMPNTPAKVGLGLTGLYALAGCNGNDISTVQSLFETCGQTMWLPEESMLDAITAIASSGAGYVFYFMEAMENAALDLGFAADEARSLAVSTFQGAAALAAQSPETLAVLRERVTSKGGTTYAALTHMQNTQVGENIAHAVKAANARAKELAEQLSKG